MLHEIEEKRRLKAEEQTRKHEESKSAKGGTVEVTDEKVPDGASDLIDDESMDEDYPEDPSNPMAALLASARARAAEYHGASDEDNEDMIEDDSASENSTLIHPHAIPQAPQTQESSRKAYDKHFKSVLSSSDIVLYVLDARDPNGTRSRSIEHQIMAADGGSKRLILILNKIDLVPPPVLKSWLLHLRRCFPTLPLRASTPAPNARTFDHKALTRTATSDALLSALKSYAHSKQLKRAITVGIIGYPNVGKSSVINALTSRHKGGAGQHRTQSSSCPVGAEAGVTTSLREVKLDNKLKLLDSPGIVFSSSDPETVNDEAKKSASGRRADVGDQARLILLNALPPKQISDPVPAVSLLLQRLSVSEDLMIKLRDVYSIPPLMGAAAGDTTTDFLVQVARKRGRLGKGGVPNLASAAMTVVMDWRDGRIQGWVDPPGKDGKGVDDTAEGKEIVREWAEEFRLEGLWGDGGVEGEKMEE